MADKDFLDKNGTSYLWGKTKQRIDAAKASVDNYTINGKKVSGSPVLEAEDVGAVPLGADGKISSRYMPSYVDDMVELDKKFPISSIQADSMTDDPMFKSSISDLHFIGTTAVYHSAAVFYDNTLKAFILEVADSDGLTFYFSWEEVEGYPDSADYGNKIQIKLTPDATTTYYVFTADTRAYYDEIEEVYCLANNSGQLIADGYVDGKIYVDTEKNKSYRWSGSQLVEVGGGVALGETSETAFRGDHGAWIYNSIMQGNPALVTPVITMSWTYFKYDGTTSVTPEKNDGTASAPKIEVGYKAKYTGTFKWTAASGKKNPTSTSGTFGTTLPASGVASASKTATVSANTTLSQKLVAPKQGLIVSNNAVTAPTGDDETSASVTITFLYKRYWGVTTSASITESVIKGLASSELTSTKSKTITGVTANSSQYYVIAYPKALGALSSIIQDGATPVLSAFTQTTVSVTNAAGYTQDYYVYRSNNVGAFTNAKLALS